MKAFGDFNLSQHYYSETAIKKMKNPQRTFISPCAISIMVVVVVSFYLVIKYLTARKPAFQMKIKFDFEYHSSRKKTLFCEKRENLNFTWL